MTRTSRAQRSGGPESALRLAGRFLLTLSGLIVAGFAFVLGVMWFKDFQQTHWTPNRVSVQFTVFSGITLVALTRAFKPRWRRARFWVTFSGVMCIRTVIYVALLRRFSDWPLILFVAVTSVEVPVLLAVLFRLNYAGTKKA